MCVIEELIIIIIIINGKLLSHVCDIFCVRSLPNAQESSMLVLISSSFHTLSVNSPITLLLADFVCNKCLVLIQTCSRTIVDSK